MIYLKRFNEEVEKSIEDWCREFNIFNNYEINDGLVDVVGYVRLDSRKLGKIPINFGILYSSFSCAYNNLISLEGCPHKVAGSFYCEVNKLITLEGGPNEIGNNELDNYQCHTNKLISLKGCPIKIGGNFLCYNNRLNNLMGSPKEVGGLFNCQDNKLISLEGCYDKIGSRFTCGKNPIFEIFKLFGTLERYKASLDYNYLRGKSIVRGRFKKACEDAEIIQIPKSIKGYKYIDL
jgi:hypothetical protein